MKHAVLVATVAAFRPAATKLLAVVKLLRLLAVAKVRPPSSPLLLKALPPRLLLKLRLHLPELAKRIENEKPDLVSARSGFFVGR